MFARDRDLLVLEPNVFRDAAWAGQRLVRGVGAVAGSTLTLGSADADLAAVGVRAGHVALVGSVAYEVVDRLSPTALTISRLRDEPGGPVIPPPPGSGLAVTVATFSPQIRLVHGQVMRMAGLDPDAGAPRPGVPTPASVLNRADLARLEALGALHLVYAAAAAPAEATPGAWASPLLARAQMYRERFAAERQRTAVLLDADGDGVPESSRRLNLVQFVRA